MEEITMYISERALVLMPVLYVIGMFLKATPKVPDWIIPWILLVVGVGCAVAIMENRLEGIIQGVLVTGASVLAHQLIRQTKKRESSKTKDQSESV